MEIRLNMNCAEWHMQRLRSHKNNSGVNGHYAPRCAANGIVFACILLLVDLPRGRVTDMDMGSEASCLFCFSQEKKSGDVFSMLDL